MSAREPQSGAVELSGLDGANPLGFLAALGALVTLHSTGERDVRLHWKRRGTWVPVIHGLSSTEPERISQTVAGGLQGREVSREAEEERAEAVGRFDAAKKALKLKWKEIRKRRLRGAERQAAIETEITPLEREYESARGAWLHALAAAVPRPELALGKRIDCTPEEYRQHAHAFLTDSAPAEREALDHLAAFGSDACLTPRRGTIEPTTFQFITGSGHQFFLRTARQLMDEVTSERVRVTLFEHWSYSDEGLSMRWDPMEDRRYALMDRDPTASDNKARTMWMANLLGYRALALFPSAPSNRGLRVVGWIQLGEEPVFTWPLWDLPAAPDTIRSLLTLQELTARRPDRAGLRARGVAAVFRARRIKVGAGTNSKLNFSPARAV